MMISLSCIAWLSVVLVQAIIHFCFYRKASSKDAQEKSNTHTDTNTNTNKHPSQASGDANVNSEHETSSMLTKKENDKTPRVTASVAPSCPSKSMPKLTSIVSSMEPETHECECERDTVDDTNMIIDDRSDREMRRSPASVCMSMSPTMAATALATAPLRFKLHGRVESDVSMNSASTYGRDPSSPLSSANASFEENDNDNDALREQPHVYMHMHMNSQQTPQPQSQADESHQAQAQVPTNHKICANCTLEEDDCDCDYIEEDDEWRLRLLKSYYESMSSAGGMDQNLHGTINMVCKRLHMQQQQQQSELTTTLSKKSLPHNHNSSMTDLNEDIDTANNSSAPPIVTVMTSIPCA